MATLTPILALVTQPGFDAFTVDWHQLLNIEVNANFIAFVGCLAKNFLTAPVQ